MEAEMTTKDEPAQKRVRTSRRASSGDSATRSLLLDATEALMIEKGYAAVTARDVANRVGLTHAVIHYYFPTIEHLLLAVYNRVQVNTLVKVNRAVQHQKMLHELWGIYTDTTFGSVAAEFMAAANHSETVRAEIQRFVTYTRGLQAGALTGKLNNEPANGQSRSSWAAGLSVLLASVARTLVAEEKLGITSGHREAREIVEWILEQLEPATS